MAEDQHEQGNAGSPTDDDGDLTVAFEGVPNRAPFEKIGFPDSIEPNTRHRPGDVIGNYVIAGTLGTGGFGVVFLATQTHPVTRDVALKIIKPGMCSPEIISRFELERQALASMDHPYIAKVFDAGKTEEDLPYFVMELVEGISITSYCDTNTLAIPARLSLFIKVCEAIQHAHQKGIIHRDLKPSNILITEQEGHPHPRVIDFGIAKALNEGNVEAGQLTIEGVFIGTPEYMSPEQALGRTGDVDTSSDIYSLGVILYELLTGRTPLDGRKIRSGGFAELVRIISENEPIKPSSKIASLGKDDTEVANCRQSTPSRLRGVVGGDLDWVVMKALEKNKERRYRTVFSFTEDLHNILAEKPVTARRPSLLYKTTKFVRRHRLPVTAGTTLATTLVVALLLIARGQRTAREHEEAAVLSMERAGIAEAIAEKAGFEIEQHLEDLKLARDRATAAESVSKTALASAETSRKAAEEHMRKLLARLQERLQEQEDTVFSEELAAQFDEFFEILRTQDTRTQVEMSVDLLAGPFGTVQWQIGDLEGSEATYLEETKTASKRISADPITKVIGFGGTPAGDDLLRGLTNLSRVCRQQGNLGAALYTSIRANRLADELRIYNPGDLIHLERHSIAQLELALALESAGETALTELTLQRAEETSRKITFIEAYGGHVSERDAPAFSPALIPYHIARFEGARGNLEKASAYIDSCLQRTRRNVDEHPDDLLWRDMHVRALIESAAIHLQRGGELMVAASALREASNLLEPLVSRYPMNASWGCMLSECLLLQHRTGLIAPNESGGFALLEKSEKLISQLLVTEPLNVDWAAQYARVLEERSRMEAAANKMDSSAELRSRAIRFLEDFEGRERLPVPYKKLLERLGQPE